MLMNRTLLLIAYLFCGCGLVLPRAATINAGEGQRWWGYYSGSEQLGEFGTGQGEKYNCAIFIPGDKGLAADKTIQALRIVIQGTAEMSDLYVWMATRLPSSMSDVDVEKHLIDPADVSDMKPFDVALDAPYAMTERGVYVGYSFTTDDPFPVITTTGVGTQAGSFYMKTSESYPSWQDLTKYNYGNLAIQVLLDGQFYANAARVGDFGEVVTTTATDALLPLTIVNWGSEGMRSIDYILTSDGEAQPSRHYDFSPAVTTVKGTATIELPFTSPAATGISHKTVVITHVNGQPNEIAADEASAHGAIISIEKSAPRRVVMEEFTGTWCGWCPRGTAGLENLEKDFADQFVGLSVHFRDPMEIPDYGAMLPPSYPKENLDRQEQGDPFFGFFYGLGSEPSYGIADDVRRHLAELTEASVELTTQWADADSTLISATAAVTLEYDRDDTPPYALAYALVADSLRGEGSEWAQNNDFSLVMAQGYADDPYLGYYTQLGDHIYGLSYNDVVVATAGIERGLEGSVSGPFVKGVANTSAFTMDISANTIIQQKRHLRLAVLLLDTKTGRIVNAADAPIGRSSGTQGISTAPTAGSRAVTAQRFTLGGQVARRSQPGISIVRLPSGEVRKIIDMR